MVWGVLSWPLTATSDAPAARYCLVGVGVRQRLPWGPWRPGQRLRQMPWPGMDRQMQPTDDPVQRNLQYPLAQVEHGGGAGMPAARYQHQPDPADVDDQSLLQHR
jgi:hypothetical protein